MEVLGSSTSGVVFGRSDGGLALTKGNTSNSVLYAM